MNTGRHEAQYAYALQELINCAEIQRETDHQCPRQLEDPHIPMRRAAMRIAELTNRIAPISTLPNEILSAIFMVGQELDGQVWKAFPCDLLRKQNRPPLLSMVYASHV